jgi:hypothetical protein
MLLFGGWVFVPLKEQAASKIVYPEDGGTSCLHNHSTYLLSYMASPATTIRTSNLSTKLCDCMKFIMRYNRHDHLLYFVCPNLLIAVCGTSYRIRLQFIESNSLHNLFINVFIYIRGATSEVVQLIT